MGKCGLTTAIATPNSIIYSFHSHTPILQFTHPIATPNSPLFSQPRPYTTESDTGDDTESDTESDTGDDTESDTESNIGDGTESDTGDDTGSDTESNTGDDTESDTGSDTSQHNSPLFQPPDHWDNEQPFYFE